MVPQLGGGTDCRRNIRQHETKIPATKNRYLEIFHRINRSVYVINLSDLSSSIVSNGCKSKSVDSRRRILSLSFRSDQFTQLTIYMQETVPLICCLINLHRFPIV